MISVPEDVQQATLEEFSGIRAEFGDLVIASSAQDLQLLQDRYERCVDNFEKLSSKYIFGEHVLEELSKIEATISTLATQMLKDKDLQSISDDLGGISKELEAIAVQEVQRNSDDPADQTEAVIAATSNRPEFRTHLDGIDRDSKEVHPLSVDAVHCAASFLLINLAAPFPTSQWEEDFVKRYCCTLTSLRKWLTRARQDIGWPKTRKLFKTKEAMIATATRFFNNRIDDHGLVRCEDVADSRVTEEAVMQAFVALQKEAQKKLIPKTNHNCGTTEATEGESASQATTSRLVDRKNRARCATYRATTAGSDLACSSESAGSASCIQDGSFSTGLGCNHISPVDLFDSNPGSVAQSEVKSVGARYTSDLGVQNRFMDSKETWLLKSTDGIITNGTAIHDEKQNFGYLESYIKPTQVPTHWLDEAFTIRDDSQFFICNDEALSKEARELDQRMSVQQVEGRSELSIAYDLSGSAMNLFEPGHLLQSALSYRVPYIAYQGDAPGSFMGPPEQFLDPSSLCDSFNVEQQLNHFHPDDHMDMFAKWNALQLTEKNIPLTP